jgi:nucleolar protein 14
MLERFAREKASRTRNSSLYNLDEPEQLTHLGQSLAEIDDFEETEIGVSDDDGEIRAEVVRQEHFGGNFDEENNEDGPVKTKAEVMQEVINKSKFYKYERQQQHDEDLDEISALDADLGELQGLLHNITPLPKQRPAKTLETMSYDAALREMVYDKRSQPSERTKTAEEIAQEERDRLEKLEEERLKRMRGEEVVTDGGAKGRREGDDLDDDFVVEGGEEDLYGFGKGATEDDEEGEEDEDGEEDGEEKEEHEEDEEDEEDDDFDVAQYFTDEGPEKPDTDSENEDIIPVTKRLRIAETFTTEIAYTFPCPSTFEEMRDILRNIPTSSIPTVIERIEILYSTKLLAENKRKLQVPLILCHLT